MDISVSVGACVSCSHANRASQHLSLTAEDSFFEHFTNEFITATGILQAYSCVVVVFSVFFGFSFDKNFLSVLSISSKN